MADKTSIEWTRGADGSPGATWNPITGCSVVSPGCTNCYAMRLAGTRLHRHPSRKGLTRDSKGGPVWTGEVRFNREWLDQPLRWTRPRMIFVCAHGDLFHESVPDEWIDLVFAVMALAPQHTFQVLTKRAHRMRRYLSDAAAHNRIADATADLATRFGKPPPEHFVWPLPNVWLGISAEDQPRLEDRWPYLATTPAAVRWISAEPLLGGLDLANIRPDATMKVDALAGYAEHLLGMRQTLPRVDWIVAGGESGPGARPMNPAWARSLRDQCAAAGVPFHWKQWGEWAPSGARGDHERELQRMGGSRDGTWDAETDTFRIGKKAAGRLLDGVEHNGMPGGVA